jgi:hypothetical protein
MVLKRGKYLESFEMWCWRRMEKISWTNHVKNEGGEEYPTKIKRRKANWIGHILHRNCLVRHVIEGKIEGRIQVTGRQGRRHKKLLDDLKEKRGY